MNVEQAIAWLLENGYSIEINRDYVKISHADGWNDLARSATGVRPSMIIGCASLAMRRQNSLDAAA
jgi:hypothetical protein